ncbi:hypothetical protein [Streptomyces silaceus]|uniref:hypothetical protein n=1 Tax=Streptomyces silaceus TaxID=545123 RepID=UPI0006EB9F2B|nr:hypothetical protein [Streptomyces silaceus]
MVGTLIAVLGTLAGTVVAGFMQHLTTTRNAQKATAEARRQHLASAIPALLAALARHREQQYLKIVARREAQADTTDARQARYAARTAVTSAVDTLHMATRDRELLAAAQEAVNAAMALGDATESELDAVGLRAREAHTALRVIGAQRIYA